MTVYFVDTSAIIKRYLTKEKGAAWVFSWAPVSTGNVIVITALTIVEVSSVLSRKIEDKSLSQTDSAALKKQFLYHVIREYLAFPLDESLLNRASTLVDVHFGLRALDSIQLAGALEARATLREPLTFISADVRLLKAATIEGFAVDNPEAHP